MRLHQLTFFAFSTLALSCANTGGQTGDLSGSKDDGGETANGGNDQCEMHKQELAGFDEMTELGTPEQVLAFAEKSFEAPLTWAAPGANWQLGPESGESSIQLEVTRGEKAYYVTYTQKPNESGAEIGLAGVLCPEPQIGIDVHVELSTEGGALEESFDTLLLAGSTRVAAINVPIKLDELSGSLEVTYSDPQVELVQVGLNATLMPEGMTGSLGGIEQRTTKDAVSAGAGGGQGLLAVWPASPACQEQYSDGSGLGVAPDENAFGITGNAAGEMLSSTTPATVAWRDGSETELTLGVEVSGDGCLKIQNNYGLEEGSNGMASYPATFTLTSADGRLDGSYTGKLVTYPNGDGNDVSAEAYLELPAAQIAESGFATAEAPSGAHRVRVQLQLLLENGGITQASVLLNGLTDPDCVTNPPQPMETPGGGMGVAGCQGTQITPIESASWGE